MSQPCRNTARKHASCAVRKPNQNVRTQTKNVNVGSKKATVSVETVTIITLLEDARKLANYVKDEKNR